MHAAIATALTGFPIDWRIPTREFHAEWKPESMLKPVRPFRQLNLARSEVHMQLIGSCSKWRTQHLFIASHVWCNQEIGFNCWLYLDQECKLDLQKALSSVNQMHLVAPSEHFDKPDTMANCCDPTVVLDVHVLKRPMASAWDGFGPSTFFCKKGRATTRIHQVTDCSSSPLPCWSGILCSAL